MKLYHLACAAVLAAAPVTAMAQSTLSPTVGADNQKEASDIKQGHGSGSTHSTVPGATGRTVVPGTNSTTATDSKATIEQKRGRVSGGK